MSEINNEKWLDAILPLQKRLTESVVTIIENLLKSENIDYLAISGRTKRKSSALEKIKRKGYRSPDKQITDLSGIRIILYFESEVDRVSKIIDKAFQVDEDHSLNQDDLMSADQIGYRSVHFVCSLGKGRAKLPEFSGLAELRFEFQVRTVLQHAWAELAHDRNYKFTGNLPKKVERQLYLYAGMLEIADRGFDEVSKQIDRYIENVDKRSESGDLEVEINTLSLQSFIKLWSETENVEIENVTGGILDDLVNELGEFGINTLKELSELIPSTYADRARENPNKTNILGIVRDWMLIHDWERFHKDVSFNWIVDPDESDVLLSHIDEKDTDRFFELYVPGDFE